jgi:hypothetical protein
LAPSRISASRLDLKVSVAPDNRSGTTELVERHDGIRWQQTTICTHKCTIFEGERCPNGQIRITRCVEPKVDRSSWRSDPANLKRRPVMLRR